VSLLASIVSNITYISPVETYLFFHIVANSSNSVKPGLELSGKNIGAGSGTSSYFIFNLL
jgi:hypothetical protein